MRTFLFLPDQGKIITTLLFTPSAIKNEDYGGVNHVLTIFTLHLKGIKEVHENERFACIVEKQVLLKFQKLV